MEGGRRGAGWFSPLAAHVAANGEWRPPLRVRHRPGAQVGAVATARAQRSPPSSIGARPPSAKHGRTPPPVRPDRVPPGRRPATLHGIVD